MLREGGYVVREGMKCQRREEVGDEMCRMRG